MQIHTDALLRLVEYRRQIIAVVLFQVVSKLRVLAKLVDNTRHGDVGAYLR